MAILGEPSARARAARRLAGDADRSRRDPADHPGNGPQLPRHPLPGRQPHDGLPGQGRHDPQPLSAPRNGHHRRLDDHARQAQRRPRSNTSTPTRAASPKPASRSFAPQPKPEPDLQADRAEPAGQAPALLRQDRPVPARNDDPGQKGRRRRADRADLGAGAGARLRQRHLVACQPPEEPVHEHQHPDRPHADRHRRPVLLPLPDRASDLQRDADLDAVGADLAP